MVFITLLKPVSLTCVALLVGSASSPVNSTQSVQRVATLRTARVAHTATVLQSGQVLVAGGMADGGGGLGSAELYDPLRNAVQPLPAMAARRIDHTATLLRDGRVLIAGGYNGEYLSSLEVFGPATRRFHLAASLAEGRSGHAATLLLFAGIGRTLAQREYKSEAAQQLVEADGAARRRSGALATPA